MIVLMIQFDLAELLHPRRLTWNLKINPWKRKIIFQTIIFRFFVNLRGCIFKTLEPSKVLWMVMKSTCDEVTWNNNHPRSGIIIEYRSTLNLTQLGKPQRWILPPPRRKTRWWFQIFFIFTPTSGNDPIWRLHIFQRGRFNHQLENLSSFWLLLLLLMVQKSGYVTTSDV